MSNLQPIAEESNKFEMILHSAMELPGIRINRADFLKKELSKYFENDVVEKAIKTNPAQAGISVKNLDRISQNCIAYETTKVTALSAASGIPGGIAMAATVPADIVQYFGHIIRILQKLAYLYGWSDLFRNGNDGFDDETSNQLILFIGIMFGVNAANSVITKISYSAAAKVEKTLLSKALTHGTVYPIVKNVSTKIGIKMTTSIFSKSVGKAIPFIGAAVSGGLTLSTFLPMSNKLKKYLITLPTASVEYYKNPPKDIVDVDFTDIDIED